MSQRSDIQNLIEEKRQGKDWPSERYLIASFAIQVARTFEQLREEQGLTYDELAERAGTSKSHVIRLLSGTYAGISNRSLAKLSKALGVELRVEARSTAHRKVASTPALIRTGTSTRREPLESGYLYARSGGRGPTA